ncbi:elongation factor G [Aeoliella sp. ICT_H6.2]|uniref:Elongation factor G n=1 Tax=Aeoliella straminimaris TaxID=2954799 RepID=A0A9X2JJ22_9BACT|nr:elongation factor G [Aeoliella straminimaris]MCO6047695.1 elongation factor G [Aeoliella straminimaris]
MSKQVDDLRNIAVCGHGSAGKTSLVDHLLVKTGAVQGNPNVEAGTSICDFDEEEKHHKHSIEAAITHCEHNGKEFTLIDTPGYPDLIGQTIGALRGVDNALIAIDGHAGIKVNTRRVWKEAGDRGLGRILCITKVDDHSVDLPGLTETIGEVFGPQCVLFNVPLGAGDDLKGVASTIDPPSDTSGAVMDVAELHEKAVETIIETDDAVMEKYFEGEVPSTAQLMELAKKGIAAGTLTPVVCVSAKNDIGTTELLDLLTTVTLSPADIERTAKKDGDTVTLKPDPSAPLAAQVFRTRIDPFVQKLSFIRVISGTLKKDDTVETPGERKGMKVGQLLKVQGEKTEPVDSAGPGEIVAIAKNETLHTGVSLGEVQLPSIKFPLPMVGLAVSPKSRGDETKLSSSLHKLAEEDPTIHVEHDEETHETVLTGMSELHLQLIQERLKRRDHVEIETHDPKIPYRETILQDAEGMYRHKKQSGGAGQFAEVHIRMYPLPEGTDIDEYATKARFPQLKNVHYHEGANFLWVDTVVGGAIPGNFMPAIEKGFLERITNGVIAGCKVQNVCVEVHFGKDHPVDSNETAFKMAAAKAFAEVFQKAKPVLLEPMVMMHITVPADNVGDVSSDLAGRRGQMVGMDSAGGGMTTVEAKCPLGEVTTYARTLSSMTGGQGSYTMEFANYEAVPGNVQAEILANAKVKADEE